MAPKKQGSSGKTSTARKRAPRARGKASTAPASPRKLETQAQRRRELEQPRCPAEIPGVAQCELVAGHDGDCFGVSPGAGRIQWDRLEPVTFAAAG